jgi:hypothetical protein
VARRTRSRPTRASSCGIALATYKSAVEVLNESRIVATRASNGGPCIGVYNAPDLGVFPISIHQSLVSGESYAIYNNSANLVQVANSQIAGPLFTLAPNHFQCIGAYDADMNPVVCP